MVGTDALTIAIHSWKDDARESSFYCNSRISTDTANRAPVTHQPRDRRISLEPSV